MAGLTPFADGIWTDTGPVSILGTRLTSTMTVIRLAGGRLLLHSPIAMTPERRAAVDALGTVAHLYAPNTFHHLWAGDWAKAFPAARLHAPKGLSKKRPDLRIDRLHGSAPEPAFEGRVEELPFAGFRLEETELCCPAARILVVADLVHNIGRHDHWWTRVYSKTMGFYDRVALSAVLRWTAFSDKAAARRFIDELLERPIDGLIVGHGAPLISGVRDALAGAYAWLR